MEIYFEKYLRKINAKNQAPLITDPSLKRSNSLKNKNLFKKIDK